MRSLNAVSNEGLMPEEFELEEELCRGFETEQERLDRQGIYGEIKRELIKRGIPAEEIAFIHDFNTPAKKARAFADANAGKIRVMIASTEKAGTGVNMQERLCALYSVDPPWRPADLEQREGRILRQGNRFSEVRIFNCVTENSFDSYMWQTLENKARFISQIMSGDVTARTSEDVDDMVMTAAQVKAIASGNPRILERVSLEIELSRLSRLYAVWRNGRRHLKWEMESLPQRVREANLRVASHEQAVSVRDRHNTASGSFVIELRRSLDSHQRLAFDQRAQAGEHLERLRQEVRSSDGSAVFCLGSYRGFQILAQRERNLEESIFTPVEGYLCLPDGKIHYSFSFGDSAQGAIQSIEAQLRNLDSHLERARRTQAELHHKQEQVERELARGWEYASRYTEIQAEFERVNRLLKEDGSEIDEKQEFAVLDQEALQCCERDEPGNEEAREVSVVDGSAAAIPEIPAVIDTAQPSVIAEDETPPAPIIVEELPAHPPITLDDLRRQLAQTSKRRSSAAPSATPQSEQMSLW